MAFDGGLVRADDLNSFAGRTESRGLLPHLIRRLLLDSPGLRSISMPADDGVWRHGQDGYVEYQGPNPFIPDGRSVWEMGNSRRTKEKAQADYSKRSKELGPQAAELTFVFVTMRHWRDKHLWSAKARVENAWKDVRAYDSEDIWTWLESSPGVHVWASREMGKDPEPWAYVTVPAQLPAPPGSVFGRDHEIEQIVNSAGADTGARVVITGQPGIGKTALATQIAYRLSDKFPDGSLFVDLRGTHRDFVASEALLERVIGALGGSQVGSAGRSEAELTAMYRSIGTRRRFLLVLDDARDEEQIRPLLSVGGPALIIATSRNRLGGLAVEHHLNLTVLSSSSAFAMLGELVGSDRANYEQADIRALVHLCGRLPLALRVVGSIANRKPRWALEHLVSRLADQRSVLQQLKAGDLEVRSSFRLSYDLLEDSEKRAFENLCVIPGPDFDLSLAQVALDAPNLADAELAVDQLVDRSLVDPLQTYHYKIHDLLRSFGAEIAYPDKDSPPDSLNRVRSYLISLAVRGGAILGDRVPKITPGERRQGGTVRLIRRWFDSKFFNLQAVMFDTTDDGAYNPALTVCAQLGLYLEDRSDWVALRDDALFGLDIIQRIRDKGTFVEESGGVIEFALHSWMTTSASNLRRFEEAWTSCEEAIRLASARANAHMLAGAQSQQADILRGIGDFDAALDLFTVLLDDAITRKDHFQTRLLEHNLGATLNDMGRSTEAIPYLEKDLSGARSDNDLTGEVHTLNTLGLALMRAGRMAEAERTLIEAVNKARAIGATNEEGNAANDLGIVLQTNGRYFESCACHLRDLELCVDRHDDYGVAQAMVRLAENYVQMGPVFLRKAIECIIAAHEIFDEETDHRALSTVSAVAGGIALSLGRTQQSEEAYKHAIWMARRANYVPGEVAVLVHYGQNLASSRRAEAADKFEEAVELALEKGGPDSVRGAFRAQREMLLAAGLVDEVQEVERRAAAYDVSLTLSASHSDSRL